MHLAVHRALSQLTANLENLNRQWAALDLKIFAHRKTAPHRFCCGRRFFRFLCPARSFRHTQVAIEFTIGAYEEAAEQLRMALRAEAFNPALALLTEYADLLANAAEHRGNAGTRFLTTGIAPDNQQVMAQTVRRIIADLKALQADMTHRRA